MRDQELRGASRQVGVDSYDLRSAELLCLEGQEAVAAADVEHPLSRDVGVAEAVEDHLNDRDDGWPPRRRDRVAELDRVVPIEGGNARPQVLIGGASSHDGPATTRPSPPYHRRERSDGPSRCPYASV